MSTAEQHAADYRDRAAAARSRGDERRADYYERHAAHADERARAELLADVPMRDGVYFDSVVVDGEKHGRCVAAVGIARCTAAARPDSDLCGYHGV
jgi:hypothetical protein